MILVRKCRPSGFPRTQKRLGTLRDKLKESAVTAGGQDQILIGIESARLLLVDILLQ